MKHAKTSLYKETCVEMCGDVQKKSWRFPRHSQVVPSTNEVA